jgi:hypothetical protein
MSAPETLTLRATAIAGERYADDYAVIWRGMSVGRILLGSGAPHDRPQWIWSCHVHGRPQGNDDRGNDADLADAKAKFKAARGAHPLGPDRGGDRSCAAGRRDQRGGGGEI